MSVPPTINPILAVLEQTLRETKRRYYAGTPGYTYDTMRDDARRLLHMRQVLERASGRPVRTKVTARAVADLLR